MARDGVGDAYEACRRLLAEMARTQDVRTRVALWRNAVRYAALGRMKRATGDVIDPPALTRCDQGGSFSQRVW